MKFDKQDNFEKASKEGKDSKANGLLNEFFSLAKAAEQGVGKELFAKPQAQIAAELPQVNLFDSQAAINKMTALNDKGIGALNDKGIGALNDKGVSGLIDKGISALNENGIDLSRRNLASSLGEASTIAGTEDGGIVIEDEAPPSGDSGTGGGTQPDGDFNPGDVDFEPRGDQGGEGGNPSPEADDELPEGEDPAADEDGDGGSTNSGTGTNGTDGDGDTNDGTGSGTSTGGGTGDGEDRPGTGTSTGGGSSEGDNTGTGTSTGGTGDGDDDGADDSDDNDGADTSTGSSTEMPNPDAPERGEGGREGGNDGPGMPDPEREVVFADIDSVIGEMHGLKKLTNPGSENSASSRPAKKLVRSMDRVTNPVQTEQQSGGRAESHVNVTYPAPRRGEPGGI